MRAFEPNVILPLAASYNTRGIAGYTNAVTNGLDQRKINLVYRPVKNALTGQTTLYLCKRPGVLVDAGSFGTTGQVAYLANFGSALAGSLASQVWVYSVSGNDVRASSSAATTVVVTAASNKPLYVDHFNVGGADTVVLQVGSDFATQTVWYSTAIATWTQISDGDFPDVVGKMEFMDGFAFAGMDSSSVQRIYNSDLNSIANWTSTNFITKQIQQDKMSGLMRLGNLIIAAGQQTMEVFRNAGNASGSPLESIQQLAQNVGIDATHNFPYYCTIGSRIYFYGRVGGTLSVAICSFDGARIERVSTPNIESMISSSGVTSRSGMHAINFQGRQAVACSLETPDETTQRWLMFFPDYNEWFEWHSTVFCPVNSTVWFIGVGANQHKLYNFVSTDNWQDNATDFDATVQFALPSNGNQRKFMWDLSLKGDTQSAATTITVKKKDNDESSWVSLGTVDLSTPYKAIRRCGSWTGGRQIQLVNGGNNEGRMETFMARID